MYNNEDLNHIIRLIEEKRLGRAASELENYLLAHPKQKSNMESLMELQTDYHLMTDYWQRGFDDPQRDNVYNQLLRRLYVLTTNIITHDRMANSRFLTSVYSRPRKIRKDWTMSTVKSQLEGFVSEVALLDLESGESREQRRKKVYSDHQMLMHDLFDYILTSRLWKDSLANAFIEILLSPTIDSIDQQLIVSAITLSALNAFGFNKFSVLMKVYMDTNDQHVRQRALVGWVLCLDHSKARIYPEITEMVHNVCDEETCRNELTELQMQLFYCMDAEQDQRKIRDEIIPDIMKGSKIKVTSHGLEEVDDDTLEDILHPDTAEQNMERMEERMKQMMEMQKQGADIYFGGFAQMKRMPFYNDLSNWFVPFYPQHPAVSNIWENAKGKKFLQTITKVGAFCDSDKYSFVLAFEQVMKQFSAKILKMIEDGEASPMPLGGEIKLDEQRQPAFIRRVYLQNLYRFFKLYPMRNEFLNPFEEKVKYLFFASKAFRGSQLSSNMTEVAAFLVKHKKYDEALEVLENMTKTETDFDYHMLIGNLLMRMPLDTEASATEHFRRALDLNPDSEKALSGYARALFRYHNYEAALTAYEQLLKKNPEHKGFMLNAAICMANMEHNEDALKLLFKLDYEYPDDKKVKRVLAWVLTVSGRYEQAGKKYKQLLTDEHPEPVDMLNFGFCLWFERDIVEAIVHFKQFLLSHGDENFNMESVFMDTEHHNIANHGISDTEIQLMLDILTA